MTSMESLKPWDKLLKIIVFEQLADIEGRTILDFGSGDGVTASFLAGKNSVTAVEPSQDAVCDRCTENEYRQIAGGIEEVRKMQAESFDMIVCHNVMEYVDDKCDYFRELLRVLKPGGTMSVIKHNRAGRVMQNVVLLNNFKHAGELLEGGNSEASKFGVIRYYDDSDIIRWCPEMELKSCRGIRTFWDLQQNQECHKEQEWQEQMVRMERLVEEIPEYRQIAFFHHLILVKISNAARD